MQYLSYASLKSLTLIALVSSLSLIAAHADTILVGKLQGSAWRVIAEDEQPLKRGDSLSGGQSVRVGADSEVVLLFDNGSTITLEAESDFTVGEYRYTSPDLKIGAARQEAVNTTSLKLSSGALVGEVSKLSPGDSFEIESSIGIAGIRGTVLGLDMNTGTFSIARGAADFLPAGSNQSISVTAGRQVQVQLPGGPGGAASVREADLPSEEAQAMNNAASEAESVKTEFEAGGGGERSEAKSGSDGNEEESSEPRDVARQKRQGKGNKDSKDEANVRRLLVKNGVSIEEVNSLDENDYDDLLPSKSQPLKLVSRGDLTFPQRARLIFYPYRLQTKLLATGDTDFVKAVLSVYPAISSTELSNLLAKSSERYFAKLKTLTENTVSNGNPEILNYLFTLGRGDINEALVEAGQLANVLLTDVNLSSSLPSGRVYTHATAFSSGYNRSLVLLLANASNNKAIADAINAIVPASVSGSTTLASFLTTTSNLSVIGARNFTRLNNLTSEGTKISDFTALLGRDITFGAGANINVNPYLNAPAGSASRKYFGIAGFEDVTFRGNATFTNSNTSDRNVLAIIAAKELSIANGSNITNQGHTLALLGHDNLSLVNVSLSTKGTLLVGTLNDMTLSNVTVSNGNGSQKDPVSFYAQKTLSVNGLSFASSPSPSNIYMEAITIDLRNVTFPTDSVVNLTSRDGGIGGRYPTFGLGSRSVGRVNFITNVKVGANTIDSQAAFDTNAPNIRINKF